MQSSKPVSQSEFSFRSENFSWMTSWYRPTSVDLARQSERMLLAYGDVPLPTMSESEESSDANKLRQAHLLHVPIGNDELINTLKLDSKGFVEGNNERLNIVLCHGYGAGLGFFYRNYLPLMNIPNARIFAFDWLGMGMSSRPVFSLYKADNAEKAIEFFLDSFERWRIANPDLNKFVLIGHSLGGYLAALYALKNPSIVQKLILVSPAGLPVCQDEKLTVVGTTLPNWIQRLWNRSYTPQWLIRFLGPAGPRFVRTYTTNRFPYLEKSEADAFCDYLYHISAAPGSSEYSISSILAPGAWARRPLLPLLHQLKMPTTFFYGMVDWMDYRSAEEAIRSMKVPAKVLRIPNSGHHLYLDNVEDFNTKLVEEVKKETIYT